MNSRAILFAVFHLAAAAAIFPQDGLTPLKATILQVSGTGSATSSGKMSSELIEGRFLDAGVTVTTPPGSSAQISLDADVAVTLQSGSLVIDKIVKQSQGKGRRILLTLLSGTANVRMQPGDSTTLLFTINTQHAAVHIQNADVNLSTNKTETILDVLRSTAKIQLTSNDLKTVVFPNTRATAGGATKSLSIGSFAPSAPAGKSRKTTSSVAILSIQSQSVSSSSLEPISDFVADEFRRKGNSEVLFLEDVRTLLRSEGLEGLLSCYTDSCISKIGSRIGVDMVVLGRVGQVGSSYTFDLKAVDVQRDRTLSRSNISVDKDVGQILNRIPEVVDRMVPDIRDLNAQQNVEGSTTAGPARNEIVYVKSGTFSMGNHLTNLGDPDELPIHAVTITDFNIDKNETTRAQFEQVMGYNPSAWRGCPECPVDNITWDEANTYCKKRGMRLPTEAEWEYACRAGTTTPFSTGMRTGISSNDANFNGTKPFGGAQAGPDRQKPMPVGSFPSNPFGLNDMQGNVAEWVADWYDPNYYGNSDKADPKGPANGKLKVVRGGSWKSDGDALRAANRSGLNPELKFDNIGVRCVK